MASITVRNLDDELKQRLRLRAAQHGHSMEEEVRQILRTVLSQQSAPANNLVSAIRARVAGQGGAELETPPRGPMREPPKFD